MSFVVQINLDIWAQKQYVGYEFSKITLLSYINSTINVVRIYSNKIRRNVDTYDQIFVLL